MVSDKFSFLFVSVSYCWNIKFLFNLQYGIILIAFLDYKNVKSSF